MTEVKAYIKKLEVLDDVIKHLNSREEEFEAYIKDAKEEMEDYTNRRKEDEDYNPEDDWRANDYRNNIEGYEAQHKAVREIRQYLLKWAKIN